MKQRYKLSTKANTLLKLSSELWKIERQILNTKSAVAWLDALHNLEPFKDTAFASWDRKAIRALDRIQLHIFKIANATNIKKKQKEITAFGRTVSGEISNFPVMVNGKFNFVPIEPKSLWAMLGLDPIEDAKKMEPYLWHEAALLGKSLVKHPNRLKICPYCYRFFWDGVTRPANQRICGAIRCKREWNAERSMQSYNEKTKRKPAAKAAKTKRRKK